MGGFNLDLLAIHLKDKVTDRGLSGRAAAAEVGCSPATFMRLLQGTKSGYTPDSAILLQAVKWVNRSLADFSMEATPRTTSIADVEVHLRALPGLSGADAEALVAMVKAAYDTVRQREQQSNREGASPPKP